ncbi:MAG: hypothetical protein PSV22_03605, partial [Pseudolabrys sp.]|nr:hypothetical protein [Pseudolabrys sp.]
VGVAAGEEMPGISPAPETASDAAPRAMPELEQSVHGDMHDQLQSADEVGLRHPAEILADLPPRAQEDVVRAAIADMIEGRPVRAAELLNASADIDPRIAESMREPAPEWMSLEELVRDAAEPRRPMEQQDLRKVLDWLGVEKPEDIGPPQLDQWERGREQYFSENPTYLTPSMPVQFGRAVIDYFSRPATRLLSEDMTAVFDRRRTAEYRPPASAARGSSPGSAWRALADARPEYENPDAVAESKEAASTPEPASIDPTKTVSAAEAAAKQADDLWKETEPTLSEREYEQFNEVLQNLDREKADRESIIREGAACLAAAIA